MATGLRSITRISRPITGGVPMEQDIQAAEKVLEPQRKREEQFFSQREALGKQATESAMGVERAKLEQQGKMLQAGAEAESEYAKTAKDLTQGAEKELEKFPFPQFKPTQEDATTYAQLGSLVATLGMMLGGGAKASSKAAIASMTGMMQGWQAGRRDLWEREAKAFDKEMQRIKGQQEEIYKNLRNSLEQASRDREASRKSKEKTVFIAGSDSIIGKMLLNGRDQEAVRMLESTFKMRSDFDNKAFNLAQSERNRRAQEEMQRRSEQLAREQIAATKTAAEAKAKEPSKSGIAKVAEAKIEAKVSLLKQYDSLIDDYEKNKDKYQLPPKLRTALATLPGGSIASEKMMSIARSDPKTFPNGAALSQFIGKLESIIAPDRHALYGANLTANELPRYERTIPKVTDDPEVFLNFLRTNRKTVEDSLRNSQEFYSRRGVDLKLNEIYDKAQSFVDTKSGVPKFSTIEEAQAANLPSGTKIIVGGRPATVE